MQGEQMQIACMQREHDVCGDCMNTNCLLRTMPGIEPLPPATYV